MDPTGYIFYEGRSPIDGAPIVGVAILESDNKKTGDMVQTYILRSDTHPSEAIANGADKSICGDCRHRRNPITGKRTCYVTHFGIGSVYRGLVRGIYPRIAPAQLRRIIAGRYVRLGAYGDPAMIRARVWRSILALAAGHTGYSHQWRAGFAQDIAGLCMASVDSAGELLAARAAGWRTFRVRVAAESIEPGEFACPASDEAGKRLQCIDCRACDGSGQNHRRASPVIIAHGSQGHHFGANNGFI
jgi:hypothetical protein